MQNSEDIPYPGLDEGSAAHNLRPPGLRERMQVIQLGPFPPPYGGVQANLMAIRDYLRSQGIRSGVINLTRYRQAPKQ